MLVPGAHAPPGRVPLCLPLVLQFRYRTGAERLASTVFLPLLVPAPSTGGHDPALDGAAGTLPARSAGRGNPDDADLSGDGNAAGGGCIGQHPRLDSQAFRGSGSSAWPAPE